MRNLLIAVLSALLLPLGSAFAQDPALTEDWSFKPPVVTPGKNQKPPSDAIVLFYRGRDLANWEGREGDPQWKTRCRRMIVNGTGDIRTKESFGDCQLHIEFRSPRRVESEGQGRGNSGVYMQSLYEVQILDSYENETYGNGQAGSVYKQAAPLVNSSRKPGKWQSYDIIYHAPKFDEAGTLTDPATITMFHNGVLIQDHFVIQGGTVYAGEPTYQAHGELPLLLQDHGNPVQYRNIWIRRL
ncbi:MAG: DUF1080 domain-containing protein [Bacteroidales bacterium]|jgi:hypothetical protein|nr:DUF1080 domain-containing protein [Bacteroidales bacterium]